MNSIPILLKTQFETDQTGFVVGRRQMVEPLWRVEPLWEVEHLWLVELLSGVIPLWGVNTYCIPVGVLTEFEWLTPWEKGWDPVKGWTQVKKVEPMWVL